MSEAGAPGRPSRAPSDGLPLAERISRLLGSLVPGHRRTRGRFTREVLDFIQTGRVDRSQAAQVEPVARGRRKQVLEVNAAGRWVPISVLEAELAGGPFSEEVRIVFQITDDAAGLSKPGSVLSASFPAPDTEIVLGEPELYFTFTSHSPLADNLKDLADYVSRQRRQA
jgi:hypothetical protein